MNIASPTRNHKAPRARETHFGEVTGVVQMERGGLGHAGWVERFLGLAAGDGLGLAVMVALIQVSTGGGHSLGQVPLNHFWREMRVLGRTRDVPHGHCVQESGGSGVGVDELDKSTELPETWPGGLS
jgi:hypothetical protein